jgi:dTDP-4-dehydrorhamnose 3,5-epimerase
MKLTTTHLDGVFVLEPPVFKDERGYFQETYNERAFEKATGLKINFVQDNESMSNKGVLRGLHFQLPPFAQDKLVRVIKGSVIDIAVDLRTNSSTFGEYASALLSSEI